MSRSRRSLQEPGRAPVGLEFAAALLPLWGFPAGTGVAPAGEQGTNNRTFLVCHGQQRYVLRVSGFLSFAEVRAEHRILRRLRQGGLPFQVPEPVAAPGGRTVIGTTAGPAAVCRWLPGVHPGMDREAAFERFGRAAGLLGAALADVPLADALRDWRTDPRWVRPGDPPVDVLCGELRSAGMSAEQAELLGAAALRAGRWWPGAGDLPAVARGQRGRVPVRRGGRERALLTVRATGTSSGMSSQSSSSTLNSGMGDTGARIFRTAPLGRRWPAAPRHGRWVGAPYWM
jgi:hypothetical protein